MGDNLYNHGEELQLNCSSQGGPVFEYTWLHSGYIIDNATASTLIIDDVSTTDGGDYTCNVTNNAGYQNNNITVYSKLLPCFCFILSLESLILSEKVLISMVIMLVNIPSKSISFEPSLL